MIGALADAEGAHPGQGRRLTWGQGRAGGQDYHQADGCDECSHSDISLTGTWHTPPPASGTPADDGAVVEFFIPEFPLAEFPGAKLLAGELPRAEPGAREFPFSKFVFAKLCTRKLFSDLLAAPFSELTSLAESSVLAEGARPGPQSALPLSCYSGRLGLSLSRSHRTATRTSTGVRGSRAAGGAACSTPCAITRRRRQDGSARRTSRGPRRPDLRVAGKLIRADFTPGSAAPPNPGPRP